MWAVGVLLSYAIIWGSENNIKKGTLKKYLIALCLKRAPEKINLSLSPDHFTLPLYLYKNQDT